MALLTVLEVPASWGEPARVLSAVADELARGPATDLVLLPEASLTGYVSRELTFDLAPFAEPLDGPTITQVRELARRSKAAIVAPLVLREGSCIYNAMVACERDGSIAYVYRKHHPWHPERWATAGAIPPSMNMLSGVRVTTAICYDLHFLEEDAAAALASSDVLLFPSAWVDPDDERHVVLPALARAHRIVIANANWATGIVQAPGQGGSAIYGPRGETLARAPASSVRRGIVRLDVTVEVSG
ncbi:MAG: 5-aminopentanamidase [Labilithrix sp.]|nr:5-aminopentanamidase [Labilithrix sp.]